MVSQVSVILFRGEGRREGGHHVTTTHYAWDLHPLPRPSKADMGPIPHGPTVVKYDHNQRCIWALFGYCQSTIILVEPRSMVIIT